MEIPYHRNCKSFVDVCHGVFGRKVIMSNQKAITKDNVIDELNKVLYIHNQNRRELDYLWHYVAGDQPILYRKKEVRPEIQNNIVENHALEITRFMTAQGFGEPIQYVSVDDNDVKSAEVDKLNKFMAVRDKPYYDVQLGDWQSTGGTSYREVWSYAKNEVDEGEPLFGIDSVDPRYNFVVYSSMHGKPALMSVSIRKNEKDKEVIYCTTKTNVFIIQNDEIISNTANGHGKILLVEYPNNARRLSDVEIVITMLDAINNIQSNRIDGIEQFVQAFIKFVNCDIDEDTFLRMTKIGALKVKSPSGVNADVDMVSNELDQEQTQVAKDDLYRNMLIIEGMPSREQNTGGDTGQAVYLRNGWDFAEQRAKIDEPVTVKAEKEFLRVVLNILKTKQQIGNLTIADIDVKITRNKTDNMLVKAQALLYLLEKGIHPKIAIKTCDLWGDPEKIYVQSKPYLDGLYKTAQEIQEKADKENALSLELAKSSSKGGGTNG